MNPEGPTVITDSYEFILARFHQVVVWKEACIWRDEMESGDDKGFFHVTGEDQFLV